MSIAIVLGKIFIAASIVFQAYLLFQDKSEADTFDKNLKLAIAQCSCLAPLKQHLQQYLRLVVAGLLASSALFIVVRHWFFKLPTFLGLLVLLWVEQHLVFTKVPTIDILNNVGLWHLLGVIGAIIYLLGSEGCGKGNTCLKKTKESVNSKEA